MKKFRLLLLDANVVIYLFEIDLWDKLVEHCEVLLSRIVAEREAQFFEKDDGEKVYLDLQPYVADQRVTVIDASVADIKAFRDLFDPVYLSRLEDGESESLAYLIKSPEKCLICSADAIVFRVLALLDRVEQGCRWRRSSAQSVWDGRCRGSSPSSFGSAGPRSGVSTESWDRDSGLLMTVSTGGWSAPSSRRAGTVRIGRPVQSPAATSDGRSPAATSPRLPGLAPDPPLAPP